MIVSMPHPRTKPRTFGRMVAKLETRKAADLESSQRMLGGSELVVRAALNAESSLLLSLQASVVPASSLSLSSYIIHIYTCRIFVCMCTCKYYEHGITTL